MKSLTNCPACNNALKDWKYGEGWLAQNCYCDFKYTQNFCPADNFKVGIVSYITFYTQDFYVYAYKDCYGYKNMMHIYNRVFPRGELSQSPILVLPLIEIDFNHLDVLNNRWKLLIKFT